MYVSLSLHTYIYIYIYTYVHALCVYMCIYMIYDLDVGLLCHAFLRSHKDVYVYVSL